MQTERDLPSRPPAKLGDFDLLIIDVSLMGLAILAHTALSLTTESSLNQKMALDALRSLTLAAVLKGIPRECQFLIREFGASLDRRRYETDLMKAALKTSSLTRDLK